MLKTPNLLEFKGFSRYNTSTVITLGWIAGFVFGLMILILNEWYGGSLLITGYYDGMTRRLVSRLLLTAFWAAGLLFGATAAFLSTEVLPHLMRRLYIHPVSIVGLLSKISFSFLITVISLILLKPWIQLLGALIKAFCLAFWIEAAILTWSSASGWLICLLFCSSILSSCSFLWFWFRHISGFLPRAWRDILLCLILHGAMIPVESYICDVCIV